MLDCMVCGRLDYLQVRSLKVWPPLINSHSFTQTLTNQKSKTVSSWLLIGLNLYERMWINQKLSHCWAPCRKSWLAEMLEFVYLAWFIAYVAGVEKGRGLGRNWKGRGIRFRGFLPHSLLLPFFCACHSGCIVQYSRSVVSWVTVKLACCELPHFLLFKAKHPFKISDCFQTHHPLIQ